MLVKKFSPPSSPSYSHASCVVLCLYLVVPLKGHESIVLFLVGCVV